MPLTPSEQLVADLCRKSFLSLWSTPNPIARPGKELCDLAVVCAPHVLVFSVKEVQLKEGADVVTNWNRWRKKAVEESVKQIYGAERWLRSAERLIRDDRSSGQLLPPKDERAFHRIAVALGGKGEVPYQQGDFGKGFVHVFDEASLTTVMRELDTITDFVRYLEAKEQLLKRANVIMQGQEEDLLALYIHQGRRFPDEADTIVIGDDLWSGVTKKPEWEARKRLDRESYMWDGLIETLAELNDDTITRSLTQSEADPADTLEEALRTMAREDRFNRRILAQSFNEFMRDAAAEKTRARLSPSLANVRYVFLATARDEDRESRVHELALRCFVARGLPDFQGDTVVGIATERYKPNAGFSLDAVMIRKPEWTEQDEQALAGIQRDLGYFANPVMKRAVGDEFPVARRKKTRPNDPCPCASGKKYKKCHGRSR